MMARPCGISGEIVIVAVQQSLGGELQTLADKLAKDDALDPSTPDTLERACASVAEASEPLTTISDTRQRLAKGKGRLPKGAKGCGKASDRRQNGRAKGGGQGGAKTDRSVPDSIRKKKAKTWCNVRQDGSLGWKPRVLRRQTVFHDHREHGRARSG